MPGGGAMAALRNGVATGSLVGNEVRLRNDWGGQRNSAFISFHRDE
jgi:hypothetical protein